MLASMNPEPEPAAPAPPAPPEPQPSGTSEIISQAEIEALLAGLESEPSPELPTETESIETQAIAEPEPTQTSPSNAQNETANPDGEIASQLSASLENTLPKLSLFLTIKAALLKLIEKLPTIPLFKKKTSQQTIAAATLPDVSAPQQELSEELPLNQEKPPLSLKERLFSKPLMIAGGLLLALLIGFTASFLNASITISSDQPSSNTQTTKLTAMGIKYLPEEFVKYAGRGNKEVTELFVQAGMSPNSYRPSDGFTPLMAAASFGRLEMINYLIEHGADVNAKDKDGQTALMKAVAYNYPQAAKLLLQAGADSSVRDIRGNTAISLASEKKDPEVLKLLPQAAGQPAAQPAKTQAAEQPLKEPQPEFILASNKAGYMQIGQSVESLYKLYDKKAASISTVSTPYPAVSIYLDGQSTPSLTGSISIRNQGRLQLIDGIRINDERFKTTNGIGINSTLGDLRRTNTFKEIKHIDQSLYAVSTGMAFELAVSIDHIADWLKTGSSSSLPDDIKIQSIIIK
ncbi:ankyrin repeat domain-containing protein [bacterium BFN5]|nr:ankyrin repeat domain-containing protein [bacterium BFN5]